MNKNFEVTPIYSGREDNSGYKWYSFKIYSRLPEEEVREYCINELRVSYRKENIPNLGVYKFVEFKNLTKMQSEMGNMYQYTVRKKGS